MAIYDNVGSDSSGGGDIIPIVKYDARAGRMFRIDREDSTNTPVDITRDFKAVFDFENIEIGYILFEAGSAPSFAMARFGSPMPAAPSPKYKRGTRIMIKLAPSLGGDVREIAGNSRAFLEGINAIHTAYEAGMAANPGKLPVVVLKDTIPVTSGQGEKKSTNYTPVFEISGWAPRPADLTYVPRATAAPATAAPEASRASPPSTGSTRAEPPKASPVADDDFG